ncbi:MAG: nucleotidyltransferase family protein [Phenylobacterium sp.]
MTGFTALVLAGSRGGIDPVAEYAGVSHKGLIVLGGETLLARVLKALKAAGATRIGVSTNDEALTGQLSDAERLAATGSPSLSVHEGARALGTPLLVTTVDHALLQPEWVRQFIDATPADADIAVLLAPEAVVHAAAPTTQRTYLKFRDGRYSACNLFLLRTPRAIAAVDLWRRVESYRKQPWRIALLMGPQMLLSYALGLLTLDGAVALIGRKAGVKAAAVRTPYGLAAVDVDKPSDLDLVRSIVKG